MTTNTDQQVAQSETPEQIAERLLAPTIGKVAPAIYRGMVKDVADALRNRDQHIVVAARAHAATERKPRIKEALLDEILDCDKCDLCEDHHA